MYVTETCGNGEVGADLLESGPDLVDVLGLSVQGVIVNVLIVDTVLLSASNTDFLNNLLT